MATLSALHKSFTTISAEPQHATPRFRMGIPITSMRTPAAHAVGHFVEIDTRDTKVMHMDRVAQKIAKGVREMKRNAALGYSTTAADGVIVRQTLNGHFIVLLFETFQQVKPWPRCNKTRSKPN